MSKHRRDEGAARSVTAYEVGYGKPPIATRFGVRAQPDRSKSPIAKAKSPALDIAALLDRPIQAKIDGRLKKIHPHEAMLHGLFKRGMEGEIRALQMLMDQCKRAGLLEFSGQNDIIQAPDGVPMELVAKDALSRKNALLEVDARLIEAAYQERLGESKCAPADATNSGSQAQNGPPALARPKDPVRKRSKAHLSFVRGQPCLICQQTPSDPHHLKFAQLRALGRKVSDEFTVPLCRPHHQDLHRCGNEKAWWANMQIAPMDIAKQLWEASQMHSNDAAIPANASYEPRNEILAT